MEFFKLDRFGDNIVVLAVLFVVYTALKMIETIYKNKKSESTVWVEVVREATTAITSLQEQLKVLPWLKDYLIRQEERERIAKG